MISDRLVIEELLVGGAIQINHDDDAFAIFNKISGGLERHGLRLVDTSPELEDYPAVFWKIEPLKGGA